MGRVEVLDYFKRNQVKDWVTEIGADASWLEPLAEKGCFCIFRLKGIESRLANIIKQEMLAHGGEAAVHRGCVSCSVAQSDVLLMGTLHQLRIVCRHLKRQPWGLPQLAAEIEEKLQEIF